MIGHGGAKENARALSGDARIDLIQPVDYFTFIKLMEASWLVLTDSGGVQEEAPVLGRPVLVLRETTERPEAVECGVARAVGTDPEAIVRHTMALLDNPGVALAVCLLGRILISVISLISGSQPK